MSFAWGIDYLKTDESGDHRFAYMTVDHETGAKGKLLLGSDGLGLLEPELVTFLTDGVHARPADIDAALRGAKEKAGIA